MKVRAARLAQFLKSGERENEWLPMDRAIARARKYGKMDAIATVTFDR